MSDAVGTFRGFRVHYVDKRIEARFEELTLDDLTPGDVVTVKESSTDLLAIQHSIDTFGRLIPDWLAVSHGDRQVVVRDFPRRDQIDTAINEQLVVELYSK